MATGWLTVVCNGTSVVTSPATADAFNSYVPIEPAGGVTLSDTGGGAPDASVTVFGSGRAQPSGTASFTATSAESGRLLASVNVTLLLWPSIRSSAAG